MTIKKFLNIPFILFIFALVLRLLLISKGPYSVDCLNLAIQSNSSLETGQLHYLFGFGYPLTVLLGSIFIWICQLFNNYDSVFAVNLMSVVLSSLTVLIHYFFISELINKNAALLSSLLLIIFPNFLGLSIFGTSHIPSLFSLELGFWMFTLYKKSANKIFFYLSAVAFGLVGASRLQDLTLMVIPISFFVIWQQFDSIHRDKIIKIFIKLILFLSIIGCVTTLLHLSYITSQTNHDYLTQLSAYGSAGINFLGLFSKKLILYSSNNFVQSLTPTGFGLAVIGLIFLLRKHWPTFIFLLLWFLVPLSFYGNLNITVSRFLTISAIPLLIAQGYYFSTLLTNKNKFFSAIGIFVFIAIFAMSFFNIFPTLALRHKHALLPKFAAYVEHATPPNALIITGDEGLFVEYYGHRKIFHIGLRMTAYSKKDLEIMQEKIDSVLVKNVPLYITESALCTYDHDQAISNFIYNTYRLTLIGNHWAEDWHRGEIVSDIYIEKLYLLEKK